MYRLLVFWKFRSQSLFRKKLVLRGKKTPELWTPSSSYLFCISISELYFPLTLSNEFLFPRPFRKTEKYFELVFNPASPVLNVACTLCKLSPQILRSFLLARRLPGGLKAIRTFSGLRELLKGSLDPLSGPLGHRTLYYRFGSHFFSPSSDGCGARSSFARQLRSQRCDTTSKRLFLFYSRIRCSHLGAITWNRLERNLQRTSTKRKESFFSPFCL